MKTFTRAWMGLCKRSAVRSSSGGGFSCEVGRGINHGGIGRHGNRQPPQPLRKGQTLDMATAKPPLPPLRKGGTYHWHASKPRVSNPWYEVDQDELFTTQGPRRHARPTCSTRGQ